MELQLSFYFYTKFLFKQNSLYWSGTRLPSIDYLGKDVDEHLEEKGDYNWLIKAIPWHMDINNYQEIINKNFIHIGVTERLQNSVNIIAEKLNKRPKILTVENTAQRDETPSISSIKKFKDKHRLEYAFYDYVYKLND